MPFSAKGKIRAPYGAAPPAPPNGQLTRARTPLAAQTRESIFTIYRNYRIKKSRIQPSILPGLPAPHPPRDRDRGGAMLLRQGRKLLLVWDR